MIHHYRIPKPKTLVIQGMENLLTPHPQSWIVHPPDQPRHGPSQLPALRSNRRTTCDIFLPWRRLVRYCSYSLYYYSHMNIRHFLRGRRRTRMGCSGRECKQAIGSHNLRVWRITWKAYRCRYSKMKKLLGIIYISVWIAYSFLLLCLCISLQPDNNWISILLRSNNF